MTDGYVTVTRTSVGTIPCFWAPTPGPLVGSLIFRVGRCDETLRTSGVTHLVEHLALSGFVRRAYDYNGWVDGATTTFFASGTPEEVAGHLGEVAAALAELPLGRLPTEKRILASEATGRDPGLLARLFSLRFGPAGYGMTNWAEFGVEWVGAEEVRGWASQHFTAANAALCFSGEPPEGLTLALPEGEASGPRVPQLVPMPSLELPSHLADGTGGVALSLLGERSTALNAGVALSVERAHERLRQEAGLSYAPGGGYLSLDPGTAHVLLNADCRDQDAEQVQSVLLEVLDDLASAGPTDEELAYDLQMFNRAMTDPERGMAAADAHARDHLIGVETPDGPTLRAERESLTSQTVAEALRATLASLIVLAPSGVERPDRTGMTGYAPACQVPAGGRRHTVTKEWKAFRESSELEVGDDAIRYVDGSGESIGWRFDDCAAAIESLSGALTVVGRDGGSVKVFPHRYDGGHAALAGVVAALGEERIVPVTDRERELAPIIERELEPAIVGRVAGEIDSLAGVLSNEEEIRRMAEAKRGDQVGLLILTDRRLLFLFWGTEVKDLFEKELASVEVAVKGVVGKRLVVTDGEEKTEFRDIRPPDRMAELAAMAG